MKKHASVLAVILSGSAIAASAQTCLDIRGDYTFVETGTLTLTILPSGGSDRCSFVERGTMRITQTGCSVVLRPTRSDGCTGCESDGFDLGCNPETCSGTVSGNGIALGCSQYWPLPPEIDGYITSSSRSASGTISGNRITIMASGRVDTDLPINDGVRFSWTSKLVLDRILDCPNILIQPSNRTVYAGATVSLAVVASHTQPLNYQWRRNGVNLAGENSPVLTLRGVTSGQAGNYTVLVRNSECTTTSVVAKLTVSSLPAAAPPWHESWESATAGCRAPSETIDSTIRTANGVWFLGDTVSNFPECGPTENRGCVVVTNGSQALFLRAATNAECAENVFIGIGAPSDSTFAIPLLPGTQISAFEQGFLENPGSSGAFPCAFLPCADTVHLSVQDDRNNLVVYIWQRADNYVEHAFTNGLSFAGYLEVFLDPAGGRFSRNLYEDFARIAGVPGVGANIRSIELAIASAGWAVLDDLKIGRDLIDTVRPTVSIVTPANNTRTNNAILAVNGKAADNRLVARVLFQTGDGPFQPALGTTNWTAAAMLEPGTNLFRVKSVDADNNESAVVTNRYVFVVTSPLTLMVGAGGKVTGATNGQLLEVGRRYALTAVPNTGYLFSNWTGGLISYSNVLAFTMTTGLVLHANFVPDPFLPFVGAYTGLFYDSNVVAHASSGLFQATVRPGGLFSASLQNGSKKYPFIGRLGIDGKVTKSVARSGTNALSAELSMDLVGAGQISGRLTDGTWNARLIADRSVYHASTNPATALTNKYTLLIPGGTNATTEPEGDGFGTVTVSKAGQLTFAGRLADGTIVSQSVPLSKLGDWPFYLSLGTVKGSMLGWLRVAPTEDNHIAGRLDWIRPPSRALRFYTNGFAFQSLVEGSVYSRDVTNHVLNWDSGAVSFSGGNIGGEFSNPVALGPGNRVTNLGPHKMTFNIVAPSGLFNATVNPPGQTRSYPFKGAVLQHQGYGGGFLLNSNLSSRVYLGP